MAGLWPFEMPTAGIVSRGRRGGAPMVPSRDSGDSASDSIGLACRPESDRHRELVISDLPKRVLDDRLFFADDAVEIGSR
jgi:hypothetical protein